MKRVGIWLIAAVALSLIAAPVWGYVTSKSVSSSGGIVQQRWRSGAFPLAWQMNPIKGSNVSGTREQADVLRQSFQVWQSLTTASISFAEGPPTDPAVKPGFDGINLVTTNLTPADYPEGALGLTLVFSFDDDTVPLQDQFGRPLDFPGQIVEADIKFNPSVQFTTNTTTDPNRIDFQSVATHEIGHFLGLDHTTLVSSTMFPTLADGFNYGKVLSADDIAGVSTIYPAASFTVKGKISGAVRTTSNTPVYGAIVVAVNSTGEPVASAVTDPAGEYTIEGLEPGAYTVYAEPMDQPITLGNLATLSRIYPGATVNSNFTTRFR